MVKEKKGTKRARRPTGRAIIKEIIGKDAIERATEYGIDITLLYENLSRTPTERIENFLRWLEFVDELKRIGAQMDIDDPRYVGADLCVGPNKGGHRGPPLQV